MSASSRPVAGEDGWVGLPDLAAKRLGGMVLAANDEFFAPKENLLEPLAPVFDPLAYTDRGKLMDGWETRRRREPGHDWCVVRLGVPGIVRGVVVDTAFFRGNFPEAFSLEGYVADGPEGAAEYPGSDEWVTLVERTPLEGDAEQRFTVDAGLLVTHVRLSIYPDGGVARLRLHGEPLPELRTLAAGGAGLDLTATANGGSAVDCSDRFYSSPHNLLLGGDARDMGDGWETKRRRGSGHDWAVVRLAAAAILERIEIDTTHFKGNYPDSCSVEACHDPDAPTAAVPDVAWRETVHRTKLRPHARHVLAVTDRDPVTHLRLNIHPDGGVARLRAVGHVTDEGWLRWGTRRLDALPQQQAVSALQSCCGSTAWAERMVGRRPYGTFGALATAADEVWRSLGPEDWREAFAAHPRIGDRRPRSGWSQQEQAGTMGAAGETMAALAEGNREYEERFGQVFLICATGRSAEEMLGELRRRMDNDPETELHVAAEEQRKITLLRLEKLMRP